MTAPPGAVMSRKIGPKEAGSSAESGDKLVTLVRPTLDGPGSSVSSNACEKPKTNISGVGEKGPAFSRPAGITELRMTENIGC